MLNRIKEVLAESTGLHGIWGENSAFYTLLSCSSWSSTQTGHPQSLLWEEVVRKHVHGFGGGLEHLLGKECS